MKIIDKKEFLENESFFIKEFLEKKIFIYPTDTIYGIGGIIDKDIILNIRLMKKRFGKPFSIIAPNKEWIKKNFEIKKEYEKYLEKEKTTLILKPKKEYPLILTNNGKVGVRILNHWFQKTIEKIGEPIITTSVNISGFEYLTSKEDIEKKEFENFKKKIDYFIYEGKKDNPPSSVIDLTGKKEIYLRL